MTAFLQADEPEDGSFDGSADGQEAVVLEESSLFASERACNLFAFLGGEDDAVELRVKDVILSGVCQPFSVPPQVDIVKRTS